MANPNPKTDHLNRFERTIDPNEPCAKNPVQVRIAQSQYEQWMALPSKERNRYLREAIAKKIQEEIDRGNLKSA